MEGYECTYGFKYGNLIAKLVKTLVLGSDIQTQLFHFLPDNFESEPQVPVYKAEILPFHNTIINLKKCIQNTVHACIIVNANKQLLFFVLLNHYIDKINFTEVWK